MTAVPDPPEDIDWSAHIGSCRIFYAERRCTCGAVPGPRFRDQLAEALEPLLAAHEPWYDDGYLTGEPGFFTCGRFDPSAEPRCEWKSDPDEDDAGHQHRLHLAELIAAEVEARVQAAANQRVAEVRRVVEHFEQEARTREEDDVQAGGWRDVCEQVAAALASPAPAPRAEEGQR